MKGIIRKWFNGGIFKKSDNAPNERIQSEIRFHELLAHSRVADHNYLEMFYSLPEVFFPINYIASRVAAANFQVKHTKDDSIVWANRTMNKLLARPNCIETWRELIYTHMVYKLCTGNSFMRAAMNESFKESPKHKYCSNIWVIPPDNISCMPASTRIPVYGVAEIDDIIRGYQFENGYDRETIPSWQIWHDRDGLPELSGSSISYGGSIFLKSRSRLEGQHKPISNLLAVYEARNVIYVKRGGLGFIISQKEDSTGSVPLTPDEKNDILAQSQEKYGLNTDKSPYGISNVPIGFIRTNLSISELQPFEETLEDAVKIASAYEIPAVLVPRKDQSTFSNQSSAEKSVYTSVVIPMTKNLCRGITSFLGLEENGLYLDCDFSDVDCLQIGLKEAEEVKKMVNDRCEKQFKCGLITFNDWRAQIGESQIEEEFADKLLFQMSDDELGKVKRITNSNDGKVSEHPVPNKDE